MSHRIIAPVRCTGSLHTTTLLGWGHGQQRAYAAPEVRNRSFNISAAGRQSRAGCHAATQIQSGHQTGRVPAVPYHSLPNRWVTQIIPTDPRRRPHRSRPDERERGNRTKSLPQRTVDVRSRERYRRRFHPGNRERADGQLRLSPIATLRDMSVHVGPHPATRTRQNVIIGAVSPPTKHH